MKFDTFTSKSWDDRYSAHNGTEPKNEQMFDQYLRFLLYNAYIHQFLPIIIKKSHML